MVRQDLNHISKKASGFIIYYAMLKVYVLHHIHTLRCGSLFFITGSPGVLGWVVLQFCSFISQISIPTFILFNIQNSLKGLIIDSFTFRYFIYLLDFGRALARNDNILGPQVFLSRGDQVIRQAPNTHKKKITGLTFIGLNRFPETQIVINIRVHK